MGLELNLTPEDIDQLVRDSIMKAGFGAAVEKAIVNAFSGYHNPVDDEIKKYVREVTNQLIRDKFKDDIVSVCTRVIAEKINVDLIDKLATAAMDKIIQASEDRW